MKDTTSSWLIWLIAISVGGRLAEAVVRKAGGSHEQAEGALGFVIVLVLLTLGLVPTERATDRSRDGGEEVDEDDEAEFAH